MSKAEFRYTDEQWAAISRELSRVGFNADVDTIEFETSYCTSDLHMALIDTAADSYPLLPKGSVAVRRLLENIAIKHYVDQPGRRTSRVNKKRRFAQPVGDKRVTKYVRLLSKAIEKVGAEQGKALANLAKALKAYEKSIGPHGDVILPTPFLLYNDEYWGSDYSLVVTALYIYLAICAKASPNKFPRFNPGNVDGPTISFLYAVVGPVWGENCPTKGAIQKWVKRYLEKTPSMEALRQGKSADEACSLSRPNLGIIYGVDKPG